MKKISNPLTIIGMFAGIAEVSGTIVLPFVSQQLQYIFIWYVMGFPLLLVLIFFITLNFNTKVLYSPSDFKDDVNFMMYNQINTKIEEIKQKNPMMEKDLKEVQETLISTFSTAQNNRCLFIVDVLNKSNKGYTVRELSKMLGVSKSTIHIGLQKLVREGLVEAARFEDEKEIIYRMKKN